MSDQVNILSQHWSDILPPLAPPPLMPWILWSSMVLALLVVLVVAVLWQQQPRQTARRTLRRCRDRLRDGVPDRRVIAHAVYHAVLQGLGLSPAVVFAMSSSQEAQWQDFYRRLQRCVFQATIPESRELTTLIREADAWLRRYPGK